MGRRLLLGIAAGALAPLLLFAVPSVRYGLLPWTAARLLEVTVYTFPPWGFAVRRVQPGEAVTVPAAGRELPADYFPPRGSLRGRLLLLHGSLPQGRAFPLYRLLARTFADRGYAVLVPDLRGYGEAPLRDGEVPDPAREVAAAAAALVRLAPAGPEPGVVLLGHSIGASAALSAVARGALRPRALVLWDPPLNLHRRLRNRAAVLVNRMRRELRVEPGASLPPDPVLAHLYARLEPVALLERLPPPKPPVLVTLGGLVGPEDRSRLVRAVGLAADWITYLDLVDLDHFLDSVPWPRSQAWVIYRPASLQLFVESVLKWLEGPWGKGRSIRRG